MPVARRYGSAVDADTAQSALTAERERILTDLARVRGDLADPGRDSAERLGAGSDDAVETLASELGEGMEADLRGSLDEVDEALQRVAAGTYGTCVGCGQAIPDARLQALPASARCMDCQRKLETR